jgi:uncharacterized LabA/DUF88 family protein
MNAVVFVDYENIASFMKEQFGKDPLEVDFFRVIQQKIERHKQIQIIDCIVYGNFEDLSPENSRLQTFLRSKGIETRQVSYNGKNCGDLELTCDVIRILYRNPCINTFVIVSNDRDFIPLIKLIKYETKVSYVLSFRNDFNTKVAEFADYRGYLEDIFKLTPIKQEENEPVEWDAAFSLENIGAKEIAQAKEVSQRLYSSHIWKQASRLKEPINLNGYIKVISKAINRFPGEILDDFKLAHHLKFVTIYKDPKQRLCIKQGEKQNECLASSLEILV